jgi:prostaglandin-endoperoxide synthase 2
MTVPVDPTDPSTKHNYVKQYSENLISLATVYGDRPDQQKVLRSHNGGRLASQRINGEEYPLYLNDKTIPILVAPALKQLVEAGPVKVDWHKMFALGHVRMNIQPGSLIFAIIFLREHDLVADILQRQKPTWDDERLFQTARNICVIEVMKIAVEDYVVDHIAFKLKYPLKFRPQVLFNSDWYYGNYRFAIEFNHLYRWHSFFPNTIAVHGKDLPLDAGKGNKGEEGLMWNTEVITRPGTSLSSIITDYSRAPAAKFGLFNTQPYLVEYVEKKTVAAGREANLAPYNDYRERANLWRHSSIDDITPDKQTRQKLKELYHDDVNQVEYYVGLMAENRGYGNTIFPPLLTQLIGAGAFRGVFANPLLSPQVYNEKTFTATGLKIIESTTLKALIKRNLPDSTTNKNFVASFDLKSKSSFF